MKSYRQILEDLFSVLFPVVCPFVFFFLALERDYIYLYVSAFCSRFKIALFPEVVQKF